MSLRTATVVLGTHSFVMTPTATTVPAGSPDTALPTTVIVNQSTTFNVVKVNRQTYTGIAWLDGVAVDVVADFPPGLPPLKDFYPAEVNWVVQVNQSDGNMEQIPMGRITNQGAWLNTLAGANACVAALTALIP